MQHGLHDLKTLLLTDCRLRDIWSVPRPLDLYGRHGLVMRSVRYAWREPVYSAAQETVMVSVQEVIVGPS